MNLNNISKWKYSNFLINKSYNFDRKRILKLIPSNLLLNSSKTISNWKNYKKTPLLKLDKLNLKSISFVVSLSNNKYIKKKLENFFINKDIEIYYPLKEMMIDNAAMIAWACMKFYKKERNDLFFKPIPIIGLSILL